MIADLSWSEDPLPTPSTPARRVQPHGWWGFASYDDRIADAPLLTCGRCGAQRHVQAREFVAPFVCGSCR